MSHVSGNQQQGGSMHQNIESFIQATHVLHHILNAFKTRGVQGVVTQTPYTVVNGHSEKTLYAHFIQCNRDSWQVCVNLSHEEGLRDPTITIDFSYDFAKAALVATHRPIQSDQSRSSRFAPPQDMMLFENACQLIRLRRVKSTDGELFTGFSTEQFLDFVETLAIHTAKHNSHAVISRRSKTTGSGKRRKSPRNETGSLFDAPE
jgi:hypothetical protein